MIKEFAVDPRLVVRSYTELKYVIEKFGFPEGRVISEFPRSWKKTAYQTARLLHGGKAELARIEERLRRIPKSALVALGRPGGDGAMDWFELAAAEHRRKPFDYILASSSVEECPCVSLEEFEAGHPALDHERDCVIRREAAIMAEACSLLLKTARHIKLIDPYFDFRHQRFVKPFLAFLGKVGPVAIEIHRNDNVSHDDLRWHAQHYLPKGLPHGVSVRMITWPEKRMHNRYLLTELGGVSFGTGLDEYCLGSDEEDYLTLLGEEVRRNHWERYTGGSLVAEWSTKL